MFDEDDGFGTFEDFGGLGSFGDAAWSVGASSTSASATPSLPTPKESEWGSDDALCDGSAKGDRVYKRGLPLDVSSIVGIVYACIDSRHHEKARLLLQHLIMTVYGQRNLRKESLEESKLSKEQQAVYQCIRREMDKPARRQRILDFIHTKAITRRLINYFVVHYALVKKELSYYLDRRTYPYKILGQLNEPNQPEIVQLIDQGADIVWLNFHQEYKNSKNKNGRRNRHAPYRRSTSVRGADGMEYSLCELNFYIWLDDVGGFDLFYMFEPDIREQKAEDARVKRQREEEHQQQTPAGKRRKEKIVLRKTDGRNYKTYALTCDRPAAFTAVAPTCTFAEYLALLRPASQERGSQ